MSSLAVIEKPMLFNAPMVLAILDGRKTQTRQVVKPHPESDIQSVYPDASENGFIFWSAPPSDKLAEFTKEQYQDQGINPPHPVGSRIWVRETWRAYDRMLECPCYDYCQCPPTGTILYRASHAVCDEKWRPSVHMPRWASRITLEITDVRVQRLQEISGIDAKAEGVSVPAHIPQDGADLDWARREFQSLWNSIHGPDAWEQNPWVWAYTFRRVESEADHD